MVASSCVEASLAGLDVLRGGGNAMDAAIAADAVLGVVEPQQTGIGGDLFALYAPGGESRVVAYNGSGRAPRDLDPPSIAARYAERIPSESVDAVTIPGTVEAWLRLNRDFGTRPMAELLAPAIRHAEEGFAVSQRVAYDWQRQKDRLLRDPAAAAAFLPEGRAPVAGEVFRHAALAETLKGIASRGFEAFYGGSCARAMVQHLRAFGGSHTEDDFAAAAGEYVEPIGVGVGDYELLECPPNGQGFVPLLMLNVLSGFDIAALPAHGAQRLHLEIEAGKLAMAVRDTVLADSASSHAMIGEILRPAYAARMRDAIDPARASPVASVPTDAAVPPSQNTVYLCVVDRDRNAASLVSSTYHFFGSGLYSAEAGVLFHSRGSGFSLDPRHANCIGPGKRPLHTIIPALLRKNGKSVMPFGVMGGNYQPYGQVRVLLNVLANGMDVQQAIDAPRAFFNEGFVDLERGFAEGVAEELRSMGHRVRRPELPLGGAQAIWIDEDRGALCGGSDPRKDGCALGY